ncbi:hypothetical protein WJX79_006395 [Trebouxia sp. C0005]
MLGSGRNGSQKLSGYKAFIIMSLSQVYCGDNATVSWRKQAARTGDGSSPAEGKPRARRAFSSLVAVMAVLLQGLLPETGKGREQTRQL